MSCRRFRQGPPVPRLPELLPMRMEDAANQDLFQRPQLGQPEDFKMEIGIELDQRVFISSASDFVREPTAALLAVYAL